MTDGALIARVVPDVTGLDKQFDYVVPPELADAVRVGSIVRVPLGPRKVRAWVVELSATSDIENLKPVASWSGIGPDEAVIDLARWAAHRWAGRLRPFLLAASPAALVKKAVSSPPRTWDPAEQRVLDPLGGVIRLPPCADPLPTLLAACSSGPILVVQPDVDGGLDFLEKLRPTLTLAGNHEARLWRLAKSPNAIIAHCATTVIGEIQDTCKSLKSEFVEYNGIYQGRMIGGFRWMHGVMFGENAVRDHAECFGNVVHAHTHRRQAFPSCRVLIECTLPHAWST